MLKNYFLIALRHLYLNPLYSAINILGLTIGIACCILMLTAVRYEFSFDRHFSDIERVYRVGGRVKHPNTGEMMTLSISAFPVAKQMAVEFEEVETYARLHETILSVQHGENQFTEFAYLTDPDFFKIFDLPFIAGNPGQALQAPFSVVLTKSMAEKYFGTTNALGKTLSVENKHDLKVTGIIEDVPPNTHFDLSLLISLSSIEVLLGLDENGMKQFESWNAVTSGNYGYIKLKPGASVDPVKNQLESFYLRHVDNNAYRLYSLDLQALKEIHLNPHMPEPEMKRVGHYMIVYSAIILAALILLTACINFINLTTARVSLRARETGMRKVVGASPGKLKIQFLIETFLLTCFSAVLACALVELLLPYFGNLINRDFGQMYKWDLITFSWLFVLLIITTLLAGLYPSMILSRLPITDTLKSEKGGRGKSRLRNFLSVVQFSLSVILILAAIIANQQLRYIANMDMGFNGKQVLVLSAMPKDAFAFRFINEVKEKYETLRMELLRHPQILDVAGSTTSVINMGFTTVALPGQDMASQGTQMSFAQVDYDYIDVYDMRLIAGHNFSRERSTDQMGEKRGAVILTRKGVKKLGFNTPEESIGSFVVWANRQMEIVGVIDDVDGGGGYVDGALDILMNTPWQNTLSLKLSGRQMADTLKYVDDTWEKFVPGYALNRDFYGAFYGQMKNIFQRVITGLMAFAILAILIACLGLYAMASFITDRRSQEIGIRKVLGASVPDILRLLLWDMSKPVLLAIVIAVPAAILLAKSLLQFFPQQVPLHIAYFGIAVGITLAIAWSTVAVHTWRVANVNPATSLRYE